jgi:NAD(P)-dependent dehydrogenase (short-subunit alcohol dehydrogenase family)
VVLITGGARGIGAATAALFAQSGARVWIGDVDEDACLSTAADLGVRGGRLDVTSMPSWRELLARIKKEGLSFLYPTVKTPSDLLALLQK